MKRTITILAKKSESRYLNYKQALYYTYI